AGFQPMPASWLNPKRSPEGRSRSISGVSGSEPTGPGARLGTSKSFGSSESNGLRGIWLCHRSAVDEHQRAGDKARFRRAEVKHQIGHFVGASEAADGLARVQF